MEAFIWKLLQMRNLCDRWLQAPVPGGMRMQFSGPPDLPGEVGAPIRKASGRAVRPEPSLLQAARSA